jgi:hypothetical protein
VESAGFADEVARRDSAVTAIRHVLQDVATERYAIPADVVAGLGVALDQALAAYAEASSEPERSRSR